MHIRTTKSRQHRPVLGLVLIAIAVFVACSRDFGIIGRGFHRLLTAGIGHNGLDLLAVTLCLSGTVCVLPPGTLVKGVVWACRAVVMVLVHVIEACIPAPGTATVRVKPPAKVLAFRGAELVPMDRRKLDDVRGALKQLGFKPAEFETIVAGLDPVQPLELMVRSALLQLRKAAS